MIAAVANLSLARGTAYNVSLVVQDAAGVSLDLTGADLSATLKAGGTVTSLTLDMTAAAEGAVAVRIPAQELGMLAWEVWLQASAETPRERILSGLVTVAERIDPRDGGNPSTHRLMVRLSDSVKVSLDSVDLTWWAYEQTRKLLGVDYASLCAEAAGDARMAETAAHTSSVNAATYATKAMRHMDAAGLSASGAATSERNAGTSAQAAAEAARTASDAQGSAAEEARELRRLVDGFALSPGTVDSLPYGASPSVSIDPGPTSGSHVLNFVLVTGPKGDKGDPGTLTANAGDVDINGRLTAKSGTFSGTINANGGINIPAVVSPCLTGAVSNHELLDFMVDRIVRMAPMVTKISGLDLAAYYQPSLSNSGVGTTPSCGSVRLNGNTEPGAESKAVFRASGLIFALIQDGPHYYQPHVTVISAPTLLRLAYRSSLGAVVQIKLTDPSGSHFYGVRLLNDGGTGYYELFYKTRTGAEVVAVREREPSGYQLFSGNVPPALRLNSLVIYGRPGFTEADPTVVRFGSWKMVVPFSLSGTADLEFSTRQGSVNTVYYGTGFGVSVASIHQIALGYNDQLVPNLDNNSYKS